MVKRSACVTMLFALWGAFAWSGVVQAQSVTVNVSSSKIDRNTGLNVEFKVQGTQKVSEPNWSPINQDFQILNKHQTRSMQIVNGRRMSEVIWRLELMPKRTGQLRIPALKFGALLSQAKVIQVTEPPPPSARAKSDVYMTATLEPKRLYVQQQALLVIKVFMAIRLSGNITPPEADLETIVEALGDASEYRVNQQGKMYQVYERRYLLFPQSSGQLVVRPGRLSGHYIERGVRKAINQQAPAIKSEVSAIPAQFSGNFWTPARKVTLRQKWSASPKKWEQGKPLTRTVYLSANGLLPSQLPEIKPPDLSNFNVYAEPEPDLKKTGTGDGVTGVSEQKFVFIPHQAGEHQLPEIKIPWWNTQSDKMEYAVIPAMAVQVLPGKASLLSGESNAGGGSAMGADAMPGGATIAAMPAADSKIASFELDGEPSSIWLWTSLVFGLGWLLTIVLLLPRGKMPSIRQIALRRMSRRKILRRLKSACLSENPELVREAVLRWGQSVWTETPPRTLEQLANLCGDGLTTQIRRLNDAIYGKGEWRRSDLLWQAVGQESVAKVGRQILGPQARDSKLEPLHRLGQ